MEQGLQILSRRIFKDIVGQHGCGAVLFSSLFGQQNGRVFGMVI